MNYEVLGCLLWDRLLRFVMHVFTFPYVKQDLCVLYTGRISKYLVCIVIQCERNICIFNHFMYFDSQRVRKYINLLDLTHISRLNWIYAWLSPTRKALINVGVLEI